MTERPPQNPQSSRRAFALFAYGFRPFFWAAAVFAILSLIAWLWIYTIGALPLPNQPPQLWHGHEMLFGFLAAAIAGFLLTAVPSWTGACGFAGARLIMLTVVWLAGRLTFAFASLLPFAVVAVCELAFLPALAVLIAPPLLRARNRNTRLLFVLAGIWVTDLVFVFALGRGDVLLARGALLVAIDIVLLLITIIGGRIVPAFTVSALRARGVSADMRGSSWVDAIVIGAMIGVVLVDAIAPWGTVAGGVAALAAIAQAWRFAGWRSLRTRGEPLVWSLHLAYAWLPVGLGMKATYLLSGANWSAHWLHALTIGAAASMVLAVMSRASLGHTGRALVASRPIAIAYVLVCLAALVRVFSPSLEAVDYRLTVMLAGALWVAAFGLFVIVYTPILMRPRIDARSG
jgi:uncharacterized protein involved in response to NO